MRYTRHIQAEHAGIRFAVEMLDAVTTAYDAGENIDACDLEEVLAFVGLVAAESGTVFSASEADGEEVRRGLARLRDAVSGHAAGVREGVDVADAAATVAEILRMSPAADDATTRGAGRRRLIELRS
jgi:hypothetical protein